MLYYLLYDLFNSFTESGWIRTVDLQESHNHTRTI